MSPAEEAQAEGQRQAWSPEKLPLSLALPTVVPKSPFQNAGKAFCKGVSIGIKEDTYVLEKAASGLEQVASPLSFCFLNNEMYLL